MNILAMRIISGEDILGEIESETDEQFVITNPVGIAIVPTPTGQHNVGFAPFPIHSEQKKGKTIAIRKEHVIYSYEPAQDFINNYNQIFGSGIVLPSKSLIKG
jgi:hypothetical protein